MVYPSPTRFPRAVSDHGTHVSSWENGTRRRTSREIVLPPSVWFDEGCNATELRKRGGQRPPCAVCRHGVKPFDATLPRPCLHGPVHTACMAAEERLSLATAAAIGHTSAPQLHCAVCYQPVTAIAYNLTDEVPSTRLPFSQLRSHHFNNKTHHQPSAPPIDEIINLPHRHRTNVNGGKPLISSSVVTSPTTPDANRGIVKDDGKDENGLTDAFIGSVVPQKDMRLQVDVHVVHHHHHYTHTQHREKRPHRNPSKSRAARADTNKFSHDTNRWTTSKRR